MLRPVDSTTVERPDRWIKQVLEMEPGKRAVAILDDISKPVYQTAIGVLFPSSMLAPGFLIAEAILELGTLCVQELEEYRDKVGLLAGVDKLRIPEETKPGELLKLETEITHLYSHSSFATFKGRAFHPNGDLAMRSEILVKFVNRPKQELS